MKNMILGALVSLTAISCVSVDGQKVIKTLLGKLWEKED